MISYRARWLLPIASAPIPDGIVTIDRGLVTGVGDRSSAAGAIDLGSVAVLPGLVNAHTHLELSWMRGQVLPASSMPVWVRSLMALRRTVSHEPPEPIRDAVAEARAAGTVLVGDVTNTLATYDCVADSDLSAVFFRELLGFSSADADGIVDAASEQIASLTPIAWLRASIVPHAPYSVSPALLRAIARRAADRPISIHLGESAAEIEFLRSGTGEWRELLEALGVWDAAWTPPACSPIEYMERFGFINERLLAVHGVQFTDADLMTLCRAGATLVTCPRSNAWTGAGEPPIDRFYASGVRVAIGTDSLASSPDLNVFAEVATLHALAPSVPAASLLESATIQGARALGFDADYGTIEPGKLARLIAVDVPPGTTDVEEYLVSGIHPGQIRWVDS